MAGAGNEKKNCSECNKPFRRGILTVVKVTFMGTGMNAKVIKSRTVAWLCPACVVQHPAWRQEAYVDAPGHKEDVDATA